MVDDAHLEESIKTWLAQARSGFAACEGDTHAIGDAALPLVAPEAVVGMAVYSAKGTPTGQGRRRLGNDGREHPLIEGIGRPVFHKENDNV